MRPENIKRAGVIAIGSNSTRMLCATLGLPLSDLVRSRLETRLFLALDEARGLSNTAINRLVDAVFLLKQQAADAGAQVIRLIATSAVRDSINAAQLQEALQQETGLFMRVLTGQEEAQYSFLGAAYPYLNSPPICVVDIGGGSTEIALGDGMGLDVCRSLQLGASRLFLACPVDSLTAMGRALAITRQVIRDGLRGLRLPPDARFLLVGGTGSALMSLIKGHLMQTGAMDEAFTLTQARDTLRRLSPLTQKERASLPGMMPGREHILPTGLVILTALMEQLHISGMQVAARNNTDGYLFEMFQQQMNA